MKIFGKYKIPDLKGTQEDVEQYREYMEYVADKLEPYFPKEELEQGLLQFADNYVTHYEDGTLYDCDCPMLRDIDGFLKAIIDNAKQR